MRNELIKAALACLSLNACSLMFEATPGAAPIDAGPDSGTFDAGTVAEIGIQGGAPQVLNLQQPDVILAGTVEVLPGADLLVVGLLHRTEAHSCIDSAGSTIKFDGNEMLQIGRTTSLDFNTSASAWYVPSPSPGERSLGVSLDHQQPIALVSYVLEGVDMSDIDAALNASYVGVTTDFQAALDTASVGTHDLVVDFAIVGANGIFNIVGQRDADSANGPISGCAGGECDMVTSWVFSSEPQTMSWQIGSGKIMSHVVLGIPGL